jgi:hypothetical protein
MQSSGLIPEPLNRYSIKRLRAYELTCTSPRMQVETGFGALVAVAKGSVHRLRLRLVA